jgi:glutaredoxin
MSWAAALAASLAFAMLVGCGPPPVPPASAAQRAQVQVTMYATRWCPACAQARSWLRRRGIPFEERDVEQSREASARLVSLNPARTVPTLVVEGRVVVGFVEEELRRAIDTAAHRH